jgi:hypothetical protein
VRHEGKARGGYCFLRRIRHVENQGENLPPIVEICTHTFSGATAKLVEIRYRTSHIFGKRGLFVPFFPARQFFTYVEVYTFVPLFPTMYSSMNAHDDHEICRRQGKRRLTPSMDQVSFVFYVYSIHILPRFTAYSFPPLASHAGSYYERTQILIHISGVSASITTADESPSSACNRR